MSLAPSKIFSIFNILSLLKASVGCDTIRSNSIKYNPPDIPNHKPGKSPSVSSFCKIFTLEVAVES